MTTTTQLTANAAIDTLTDADYRDIYNELRRQDPEDPDRYAISLDTFGQAIHSTLTKASWSKYHRGLLDLNRTMRNELRAAVGLPALPPTIAEATAHLHPNATITQIGDNPHPHRALLIAANEPLTLHINGSVTVQPETDPPPTSTKRPVTPVTRSPRRAIYLPVEQFDRINRIRQQTRLTWPDLLAQLA